MSSFWDGKFGNAEYVYGTEPNDFLKSVSAQLPPKSNVLSIGEGEGRNAIYLAKMGHSVLGVDSSTVGLEKARKLAQEHGVSIQTDVADLATYDIGEAKYDSIVSIFCHLSPSIRKEVYKNIVKGLVPGGILIMESYTPKQLEYKTGGPPVAEMMSTIDELSLELEGLDFEIGGEKERNVVEGSLHTGKAHVVQVLGRKKSL